MLLKLATLGSKPWSYHEIATSLSMSPSEVHAAVKRALAVQLAIETETHVVPNLTNLEEFLIHGLKYVFAPDRGETTRGIPTRYAAPPLLSAISSNEPPPVWPDPDGNTRGTSFSPLYISAPKAARADQEIYELLVLADALRGGSARERALASKLVSERLKDYAKRQKTSKP